MSGYRYFINSIIIAVFLMALQIARGQIPPSIITQPKSQVVNYGSDVVFNVSATGTEPLSYQWWYRGHKLEDYNNVAGSQTPTLYLVGVGQQNAKGYSVVINNAAGSVTSSSANLTVGPRLAFQDNFANGLAQWVPLLDGMPLNMDQTQKRTPDGGSSVMMTNSAQKMYARLNPKLQHNARLTLWIYDAGGPQTAYAEMRGYGGFYTGYAKYIADKGLRQAFGVGIYTSDFGTNHTGSLANEKLDPTRYQGRVLKGGSIGWFNLNAPGAPSRSIGWHKFQMDRIFRDTINFYVDGVLARTIEDARTVDFDTVIIGSTGLGESNQLPVIPVSAWFGGVTVEEPLAVNYNYRSLASRGPIPDVMQARETGTNAADVDVSATTVCELSGAGTNGGLGSWAVKNSEIIARDVRGYLEYTVKAPTDNAYRIELEGREADFKAQVQLRLRIRLDGEDLGTVDLPYGMTANGLAHCFTPFIRAGSHTLGIFWDNTRPRCSLALHAIRLQSLTGGASVNGMSTWVANRLRSQCGMDSAPDASFVSPVCLEGRGQYLSMMSLNAGTNQSLSPVTVRHGAGNRWYANVSLSPGGTTHVQVSYQNGGLTEANDIVWQALNLLEANGNSVTIRTGDWLLLTALPDGATNGAVTIQVGQTSLNTDASTPVPCQFTNAGTFTVTGLYGPTGASGSMAVTVVGATLSDSIPASVGSKTYWDCTNTPGVVLDIDPRLSTRTISAAERAQRLTNAPALGVNGQELKLMASASEPRYVLARLGTNGPILAGTAILGFQFTGPPMTSFRRIATQADGSEIIEGTFVLSPLVPGVSVDLGVAAAGVMFGDGTLTKTLTTADFGELGICRLNLIRAAGVDGSACMLRNVQTEPTGESNE